MRYCYQYIINRCNLKFELLKTIFPVVKNEKNINIFQLSKTKIELLKTKNTNCLKIHNIRANRKNQNSTRLKRKFQLLKTIILYVKF